jgi:16S rRNA (guanine527-N7)-methyltransferase
MTGRIDLLEKYFDLTPEQKEKFLRAEKIYRRINRRINLISRKDIDHLYERHFLHSLAIAKFTGFAPGAKILDAGTGGGFPGIPLAIFFPQTRFHLVDSTGKKIRAVEEIVRQLQLQNVSTEQTRLENHHSQYDFIVSRAVTRMDQFVRWTKDNLRKDSLSSPHNGILYLKGGDLSEELKTFPQARIIPLRAYFDEPFFQTKKLVYLPAEHIKK